MHVSTLTIYGQVKDTAFIIKCISGRCIYNCYHLTDPIYSRNLNHTFHYLMNYRQIQGNFFSGTILLWNSFPASEAESVAFSGLDYSMSTLSKIVSMIRKYHNHKPQTTPWNREEEPLNHHETPGRQIKQSNQLSLPHQDDCNTRMEIK